MTILGSARVTKTLPFRCRNKPWRVARAALRVEAPVQTRARDPSGLSTPSLFQFLACSESARTAIPEFIVSVLSTGKRKSVASIAGWRRPRSPGTLIRPKENSNQLRGLSSERPKFGSNPVIIVSISLSSAPKLRRAPSCRLRACSGWLVPLSA